MARSRFDWIQPWLLVEVFVSVNLGFLTFDIYLAHSVNNFRRPEEYIPLYFSAIAPAVLFLGLGIRRRWLTVWKDLGYLVGWSAILIGLTGVILHLDSSFFYERTVRSLTYSAPFAAPLAYTGLGFLLLVNRMVDRESREWVEWVLLMALGGFIGNFVFSLVDHAGNGFFDHREWAPVWASAFAVGFLAAALTFKVSGGFLRLCSGVLLVQAGIGIWGFWLHAAHNLRGPSIHSFRNFVYGAPPLAPLLFPNLVLLGLIPLWRLLQLSRETPAA